MVSMVSLELGTERPHRAPVSGDSGTLGLYEKTLMELKVTYKTTWSDKSSTHGSFVWV